VLVLASASPRRRELLARLVPVFGVVPAAVDETLPTPVRPADVIELALRKARAVAARPEVAGVVLGADTVVVIDGEPLGKPADAAGARRMLARLRGRVHEVVTGLAAVDGGREVGRAVVSRVVMGTYDTATIDAYVATGEPLDKAGAYAVQEGGGELVLAVIGSYSNVVGLPLAATRDVLGALGIVTSGPAPRP
jgi:septum formation protein